MASQLKARDRFSIRWSNDGKVSDGGEISKALLDISPVFLGHL